MATKTYRIWSLIATVCCLQAAPSFAQSCTAVAAVPLTITQPGNYCVTQHLFYEGAVPAPGVSDSAITVATDNVTINFGGYTLQGGTNAASNPLSAGIRALDRRNVAIRNGTIRSFGLGVHLSDVTGGITPLGYLVEHMLVDGGFIGGIIVNGQNGIVRSCRVINIHSTNASYTANAISLYGTNGQATDNSVTNVTATPTSSASGIYVNASGSLVQNNSIQGINPGRVGFGISVSTNGGGSLIRNNVVSNASGATGYGIVTTAGTTNVTVDGNTISGLMVGVNLSSSTTNKYKNNTVNGTSTPYYGGTDIGGNH
jgi:parallel beta-helix repeat protein